MSNEGSHEIIVSMIFWKYKFQDNLFEFLVLHLNTEWITFYINSRVTMKFDMEYGARDQGYWQRYQNMSDGKISAFLMH